MATDFQRQREAMVKRYKRTGYLHSEEMVEAIRRVPREVFMPYASYPIHWSDTTIGTYTR
jgi:protein-L-isoaspartate O-methyltransferase